MSPALLIDALHGVRRRVRVLSVAFGVGLVLAAGVGLLLAIVLFDYLLNLPAVPRVVLLFLSAVATAYVLAHWVVRPVLSRLTLGDVAGRLEQAFPQFDDRLRSTVNFIEGQVPGSDVMKDRVIAEATELARRTDLNRAVVMGPVYGSLAAGLGMLLLVAVLAMTVDPRYVGIALSRMFTPFAAQAWPKRVQIDLLGHVPVRVPVGQRVDLRMRLAKGDKTSMKAVVIYQYDDGPEQQEYMTRGEDGVYSASLDARSDPTKYLGTLKVRIRSGDDALGLTPITVVPRLAVTRAEVTITPPAYAQRPATTSNLVSGPAVMPVGARLAVTFGFNKSLAADKPVVIEPVNPDTPAPPAQWDRTDETAAVGSWTATQSLRFHVRATDIDNFQNSALEEYELIVRPDQNPTVQIENPRRNEERTPVATVPLRAVAEDDYGISALKLVVERLGDKKRWEIPLVEASSATGGASWQQVDGSGDRAGFRLNYAWELAKLDGAELNSGDVLEYFLEARDNFELDGQTHDPVASGRLRIAIISQEELTNRLGDELRTIAHQVNEIKNTQDRTKEETGHLAEDTQDKPKLDAADKTALERLANQQATAASQTKLVASRLEAMLQRMQENRSSADEMKQIAEQVKDQLENTAEQPMKQATSQLGAAREQMEQSPQRNESLKQAGDNQQQASDQLQRALDKLGNVGSLQQTIDKIRDLLNAQRRLGNEMEEVGRKILGKKPEEMSPEDRERLEKAAREQQNLAGRTERTVSELQKLSEQLSRSDPSASNAMKQAATTAQQQQVSASQSKAAQQARQNQQAAARTAQKQAELGLEMMLNDLREAERRKLEELARQLAELDEQIANLVRRQAGHNLDNLTLQGPERLAQLPADERESLTSKAERDPRQAEPAPQLPQLTVAQEQTERNTRDIARTAEKLPSGAEPAAHLVRAAARMERAIISLRDKLLPAAYEPPQVEALAALEEAKNRIDEQLRQAQDKIDAQQRETIRQAYIKIKEDQEKVNQETTRIDESPRLAEGGLRREEAIRLGQLPGEQGALADRINKLGEDLSALGSIVYIWANRDIAAAMNGVKDALGQQQTGKLTQGEQARIVEQLDEMIRHLAIKPAQEKFAQRGGGGGSGAGQPKPQVPSEAELQLLKALQLAVNRNTKLLDAVPAKDAERLIALGDRQGALRDLLDQLLQKASRGQIALGPEPDNRDLLPEEAGVEQIENQELEQDLLNDAPDAEQLEKDMNLVGDRMARSKQRLALNHDPGKVTQLIQERIIIDLDALIQQARNQQSTQMASAGQAKGKPADPQDANPENQGAQRPRTGAQPGHATEGGNSDQQGSQTADLAQDIVEKMTEWGGTTPRQRQAVIEGAGETVIQKYKNLVDDYYRALATKAAERE